MAHTTTPPEPRHRHFSVSALLLTLLPSLTLAAPRPADLVHPQLLSDTTAIQPGHPFHLAILLHISPHWHVYWKNPGDSGQAVSATFTLPPGFSSSPLQFPVPTKFLQPGDLIAYGYENEVLLLTTITPPANLSSTDPLTFQATLKFLVCDQICLPGHASLSLSLPISPSATPANADLFKEWLPQFPTPPASLADIRTTSSPLSIDLTWHTPADNIEFFPGPSPTLTLQNITILNHPPHSHITLTATPLTGQPLPPSLTATIVYTDDHALRRGLDITIPLTQNPHDHP